MEDETAGIEVEHDGLHRLALWLVAFAGSVLTGAVLGGLLVLVASFFMGCATPAHNYVPPLPQCRATRQTSRRQRGWRRRQTVECGGDWRRTPRSRQ